MIVKIISEDNDSPKDCKNVLDEIKDKMEADYPEITAYITDEPDYLKGESEDEWYDEAVGLDFVDRKVAAVGIDWLSPLQKAYYSFGNDLERGKRK